MTLPIPQEINAASSLVSSVFASSRSLAQSALLSGMAAIEQLGNWDVTIPALEQVVIDVGALVMPPAGVAPSNPGDLSPVMPELPAAPVQGPATGLVVGEPPAYTLVAPTLLDIALPDPFDAITPPTPDLLQVGTPVEPNFTLPPVPLFAALNIPDAPSFEVPLFTDAAPTAPAALDAQFTWSEVAYASDQLAQLNARLLALVQGASTALAPSVEDALWQRGCDAEAMLTYSTVEDALQQSAARGFTIPAGQLVRIVQEAVNKGLQADTELSRQIMVEQVRLEQANFQFAFGNAITLESRLIELFNQVQQRALEAAKFRVQSLVELFNARVNLYQAEVTAFGAKAAVFSARLQGALAQLELYRASLEALKIKGQLNVQLAQQYSAQIAGVEALTDVFRARTEAVALTVATNRNRTELFKAQIDAYGAKAKGAAGAVQGYLAQIQAEHSKVELFGEQVKGYGARIDAHQALTGAKLAEANFDFRRLQQFPVELYKAQNAGYQAQVSAEAARLNATASVFQSRLDAYGAIERVQSQRTTAEAEVANTAIRLNVSAAKVNLQSGAIQLSMSQLRSETAQAALRAAGQLSAQLAAAAMSARNVSASLTGSYSNSSSNSASNSKSESAQKATHYNSTTSTNFSASKSKSNRVSMSTTESRNMSTQESASFSTDDSVSNVTNNSSHNDDNQSARNSRSHNYSRRMSYSKASIYRHKG